MGKNCTIKSFQTARLDEWIGDYKSADLAYEEIQTSNDKLSFILEKTIEKRKRNLHVENSENNPAHANDEYPISGMSQGDNGNGLLYQFELLQPRRTHEIHIHHDSSKLKYSVSIMSKVDDDLRLEIRGYNPAGDTPKLNTELQKEMTNWAIESSLQFAEAEAILLEINAHSKVENTIVYLSIDQWGLLCGSIIINENCLGDILIDIHLLISSISNKLW